MRISVPANSDLVIHLPEWNALGVTSFSVPALGVTFSLVDRPAFLKLTVGADGGIELHGAAAVEGPYQFLERQTP